MHVIYVFDRLMIIYHAINQNAKNEISKIYKLKIRIMSSSQSVIFEAAMHCRMSLNTG